MKTKSVAAALLALALMFLSGCITTNVKGYSDTDFQNHKLRKVMVRAPNVNFSFGAMLESSMVKELAKVGIPAESFLNTFPPTRDWTNEKVTKQLLATQYDSIMYVNLVDSGSSTQTVGYINNGHANVYGNSANYSGTTMAMVAFKRSTSTRIQVFDTRTAKTIWIGDAETKAGGSVFMGDETTADDIAAETVAALKAARHI